MDKNVDLQKAKKQPNWQKDVDLSFLQKRLNKRHGQEGETGETIQLQLVLRLIYNFWWIY